jgi:glutaredoxin
MKEYVIFGRSTCPWTQKAIELAEKSDYSYTYIEVPLMPSSEMGKAFQGMASEEQHTTVPCVFEVKYIGGFTDLEKDLS